MSTTLTIAASADKNAQLDLFSPTSGPPIVGVVVTLNRPCAHCGDTTVTVGSSAGPHHARLNCIGCGAGWLPRSQYRALVNAPGCHRHLYLRAGGVSMSSEANLAAALALAARGIYVFPALASWNAKAGKLDKRPAISEWQTKAATDGAQVREWWRAFPAAIPGIELGRSGLFVVDLDRHPGGADGLAAFKAFRGDNPAPSCPTVKTASGGYHLYFKQPEGEPLGNRTGTLPAGVDCRGAGGWTVAPGAVFEQWRWIGDVSKLATAPPIPPWIVSAIRAPKPIEYSASPSACDAGKRERAYAERAINNVAAKVAGTPRGSRNSELNAAAFSMGTMLACNWIGRATVEGRLWDAAAACGLLADDGAHAVRSTIRSGLDAGLKQPHAAVPDRNPERTAAAREREPAKARDPAAWQHSTFTAASLQTMEFTPISWIVPSVIPAEGVTLLASRPKFGKSWLAYDLCIGVTMDRFVLGEIRPKQGDVIYLALEDSKRRLQRRMAKLLPFGSKWPERLTLTTEWRRLHEGGLDDLRAWHNEVKKNGGKPALAVIDVLAKVRKPTGNRPAYEADYEALTGIAKLAHELAVAIVVLHHVRKMQSDDLMEMVSGTYGITGAVDTVLVLANKPNGAVLDIRGRDVESAEMAVEFNKATCRWRVLGDAAEVHRSEQQTKILTALQQAGTPMAAAEIESATGIKHESLSKALFRLASEGAVKRVGRGLYALPDWQPPPKGNGQTGKTGKRQSTLPVSDAPANRLKDKGAKHVYGQTGKTGSLGTPSVENGEAGAASSLSVQTLPVLPGCPFGVEAIENAGKSDPPKTGNGKSGLPVLPVSSSAATNGGNGVRPPRGALVADEWTPASPFPKPDGSARVRIREIRVPAIAAGKDDDIEDIIGPRWRQ